LDLTLATTIWKRYTSSHGGKYRYRRKGILDEIAYRKLLRGVIIVRLDDVDDVVRFLSDYNAEVHVRKIELTEEDWEVLGSDGE
jgi:hypothetical protein